MSEAPLGIESARRLAIHSAFPCCGSGVLRSGIYGMDFYVQLTRPGNRVAHRKRARGRIGHPHRVTKEDSIKWFQQTYDGIVLNH